ncbi:MAG: hypothetical protein ACI92S_000208, partial [Planctomycetaceae bacterium]
MCLRQTAILAVPPMPEGITQRSQLVTARKENASVGWAAGRGVSKL